MSRASCATGTTTCSGSTPRVDGLKEALAETYQRQHWSYCSLTRACPRRDLGASLVTSRYRRRMASDAPDRAVDGMLAEFNALRAALVSHSGAQAVFVGVALTGVGIVIG